MFFKSLFPFRWWNEAVSVNIWADGYDLISWKEGPEVPAMNMIPENGVFVFPYSHA